MDRSYQGPEYNTEQAEFSKAECGGGVVPRLHLSDLTSDLTLPSLPPSEGPPDPQQVIIINQASCGRHRRHRSRRAKQVSSRGERSGTLDNKLVCAGAGRADGLAGRGHRRGGETQATVFTVLPFLGDRTTVLCRSEQLLDSLHRELGPPGGRATAEGGEGDLTVLGF